MSRQRLHTLQSVTLASVSGVVGLMILMFIPGVSAQAPRSSHNIYIAFGFHGNLYHSFRNDTNDESGFGKDIRVIRNIIATLDSLNQMGIPVKADWDFDNLFSLQEILPQNAPDIIEAIRRRIRSNGDEAILMSYNNGLVSAMNREELTDAMRWAVTNPWHSGVQDVFGACAPIVRPQEMMTTPGDFSIYKQLGIQAVALYYSATPFDAFRVFSRPLTRAEAHNPILYKNPVTGEEMTVIPSYHIGDLVEHVSLRNWVEELRRLQEKGELNRDALIFINFDADSDFWSGVDLPWALKWLPNTHGLGALVHGVQDLAYVRFTTLSAYLHSHPPTDTFYFSQDTADGSFNGYNSWAEKARVSPQWTRIERSRRLQSAARKATTLLGNPPGLADISALTATAGLIRLRALSTTNFGMATPYVAPQREQAANDLIARLDRYSDDIEKRLNTGIRGYLRRQPPPPAGGDRFQWLDSFVLLQTGASDSGSRFLKVKSNHAPATEGPYVLAAPDGRMINTIPWGRSPVHSVSPWLQLYVPGGDALPDGVYHLYRDRLAPTPSSITKSTMRCDAQLLSNGIIDLQFDSAGRVEGIYLNGVRQAEPGSLMPYLRYGDKTVQIESLKLDRILSSDGHSASVRLSGAFPALPGGDHPAGTAVYTISLLAGRPYLLLHGEVTYPASDPATIIKAEAPGLSRRIDGHWSEVAPAEIRFAPRSNRQKPVRILKRNFLGVEGQYSLDYFRHSADNLNLDNVNNHITASYVGVVSGGYGLAIAMDTTVLANFAFAPLKLTWDARDKTFEIRANPFGTYYGRQYRPPTWGNGQGYEMTLYTGEHLHSAAPTYNGVSQKFDLLISFFKGEQMSVQLKKDLLSYAHPPMAVSMDADTDESMPPPATPKTPTGFAAAYRDGAVNFFWHSAGASDAHYRVYCGTRPGKYERIYPASGNRLRTTEFIRGRPFATGRRYYARIETVSANGRKSAPSKEFSFKIKETADLGYPGIPMNLKIRVLWSSVRALINDFLL